MTEYDRYDLSRRQRLLAILTGCAVCYAAAWIVCRQPVLAFAAVPAGLRFPRLYRGRLIRGRKVRLRLHFKEMLQVLVSLLGAGRSVENAFLSLEGELHLLLGDFRSDLLRELRTISVRMRNGEPLEPLLTDFGHRSGVEEIRQFADAFSVCKRTGGDLVEIVRRTSQLLGEKLDVELEVSVLLAQKTFESRIMMAMPFAFVGFLGFLAPDYLAPLHRGLGWVVLAACLLLLAACCFWIGRIMRIEV